MEELPYEYMKLKTKMANVLARFQEIGESFEQMVENHSSKPENSLPKRILQEQIEQEIISAFPSSWIPPLVNDIL